MNEAVERQVYTARHWGRRDPTGVSGFWAPDVQAVWKPLVREIRRPGMLDAGTVSSPTLMHGIRLLHLQLRAHAPEYRRIVAQRRQDRTQGGGKHWDWQDLYEDEQVRVGALTVHPDRPIPLHDHPGARGLHLVVAGSVRIEQFGVKSRVGAAPLVELVRAADALYGPGDVAAYGEQRGNIHGLDARDQACVMLTLTAPSCAGTRRAWYFPFEELVGCADTVLAERVAFSSLETQ